MPESYSHAVILQKSITETDDGDVIIPVIGIPFGGPVKSASAEGGDMVGDTFTKDTNLGPLTTVISHFDHGNDELYIPKDIAKKGISFGKSVVGTAVRGETTEEGVLYRIIVDRRYKYKQLLKRLAQEGMLDVSSRAIERIDDPKTPGRILEWHTVGMDLTPSPMNPAARALIEKSLSEWKEEDEEKGMPTDALPVDAIADPVDVATTPPTDGATNTPVTDQIRTILNAAGDANVPAGSEEAATLQKALEMLEAIEADSKQQKQDNANLQKSLQELIGKVEDMQTAFPVLAEAIASNVTGRVRGDLTKSRVELDAEKSARDAIAQKGASGKSALPPHAPGMNPARPRR